MIVQKPIPEPELLTLLDSVRHPDLETMDCQILAALEFGYSHKEIAGGCAVSDRTVGRRIEKMISGIFTRMGIVGNERLLVHWSRRHGSDCTWFAQEMARNGQIFAAK